MAHRTLEQQVRRRLDQKKAFGISRREEKSKVRESLREAGEKPSAIEIRVSTVHSTETLRTYQKVGKVFCSFCIGMGASKRMSLDNALEQYATTFLKSEEEAGKSIYTLKMERAALGKLAGHPIEYPLRDRERRDITRSREEAKRDRHFSESRNPLLVLVAKATGCRRSDLAHLRWSDFKEIEGHLYVQIIGSKGGRDRFAPVLPSAETAIREVLAGHYNAPERVFESIPSCMDVHSYRRVYAQSLYEEVTADRSIEARLLRFYPERRELVKGEYYIGRGEDPFKGRRDSIYIVSQALGHNRLDVTVNHYLR